MRISSAQIFSIANKGMADANEAMVNTQEQLSSGLRVLQPSDDPVASTKIMQLTTELANVEQYKKNIDIAKNNLVLEEAALHGVTNLLHRMQELAVQAGNTATFSPNDYKALASEVDARLDELTNILNTQNANGDYIFGGYKSTTPPFSGNAETGFQYEGDDGQMFIKVANNTSIAASDSGKELFIDIDSAQNTVATSANPANRSDPPIVISVGEVIDQQAYDEFYPEDMIVTFNPESNVVPSGRNFTITARSSGRILMADQRYTPGAPVELHGIRIRITGDPVSGTVTPATTGDQLFIDSSEKQGLLTTLGRFGNIMADYDGSTDSRDSLESTVATTLSNLKNAQTSILDVVSRIGARFNTLESTQTLHQDSAIIMKDVLSELRDVDYAEAATRLSAESMVLQAAQSAFIRVSQLTLFSRL